MHPWHAACGRAGTLCLLSPAMIQKFRTRHFMAADAAIGPDRLARNQNLRVYSRKNISERFGLNEGRVHPGARMKLRRPACASASSISRASAGRLRSWNRVRRSRPLPARRRNRR